MMSPVWHRALGGSFQEAKQFVLKDVDPWAFKAVVNLCCGDSYVVNGLSEIIELANVAHIYDIVEIFRMLEEELKKVVDLESCAWLFAESQQANMMAVEAHCRAYMLQNFDAFSATNGFMTLEKEVLYQLLDDDQLQSHSEEAVFEALVRWMHGNGDISGEALLRTIRFPLMSETYLQDVAAGRLPECPRLKALLLETGCTLAIPPHERRYAKLFHLSPRALERRTMVRCTGLGWPCRLSPIQHSRGADPLQVVIIRDEKAAAIALADFYGQFTKNAVVRPKM